MTKQTVISKDVANKKLLVEREFDAPVEQVWKAWTESSLLDKWWAPRPWRAETKSMDFREGGVWLYCMVGPNEEKAWCRLDYKKIVPQSRFTAIDSFCDDNGNLNSEFPRMDWTNEFSAKGNGTIVKVEILFSKIEDMDKIIEMGFEAGFTAAHGNLDELLLKSEKVAV